MCWKKSGYALKIIDLSARSRLPNVVRGRKTVARNNLSSDRRTKEVLQVTNAKVARVFQINNDKLFNEYSTDKLYTISFHSVNNCLAKSTTDSVMV